MYVFVGLLFLSKDFKWYTPVISALLEPGLSHEFEACLGLYSKFQDSQGYVVRPCLDNKRVKDFIYNWFIIDMI